MAETTIHPTEEQQAREVRREAVPSLVEGMAGDVERLVKKQLQLFRVEFKEDWNKAKFGVFSLGSGAGLFALSGILGAHASALMLHKALRIPLWLSYAFLCGFGCALGTSLMAAGVKEVQNADIFPEKTDAERRHGM